eukprot:scaffold1532_cov19-Prasinocladus_malaysianus.AAC.1
MGRCVLSKSGHKYRARLFLWAVKQLQMRTIAVWSAILFTKRQGQQFGCQHFQSIYCAVMAASASGQLIHACDHQRRCFALLGDISIHGNRSR